MIQSIRFTIIAASAAFLWFVVLSVRGATASGPPPVLAEAKLFDYDAKAPLDVEERLLREEGSVEIRDVTYASPKGGRVSAYLVVPKGAKAPFAGIAFGHWGAGNRTEFLAEAIVYARAGAVSILIDYPWTRPAPWRRPRGAGLSEPEKDRDGSIQAVVDLRRAFDLLLSRSDVDPKRIAYVGHSFGAQWGAILAAVDRRMSTAVLIGGAPDLAGIVLESNEPDIIELRKAIPKEQLDRYFELLGPLDAIRYVGRAAPISLLFQFARFERYFNESAMKRYYAAAGEPKSERWYPTGHELNDLQAFADRSEWLQKQIGIAPVKIQGVVVH